MHAYVSQESQASAEYWENHCIQSMHYAMHSALSAKKLDTAEGKEQLNLTHHETEKSPGSIQENLKTIPADSFSLLIAISQPLLSN